MIFVSIYYSHFMFDSYAVKFINIFKNTESLRIIKEKGLNKLFSLIQITFIIILFDNYEQ